MPGIGPRCGLAAPMGEQMAEPAYPTTQHDYGSGLEENERVEAAMDVVPKGAVAVSGISVGLLILCWLAIYVFVFLPRGTVG
jgi:hypothetical protein